MAEESSDVKAAAGEHRTTSSLEHAYKVSYVIEPSPNNILNRMALSETSGATISTSNEENASTPDGEKPGSNSEEDKEEQDADSEHPFVLVNGVSISYNTGVFQIVVKLPHEPYEIQIMVCTLGPSQESSCSQ